EDDKRSEEGSKFLVKEIEQGVIYENNGVKVIAFEVDHYPVVPAFGYRNVLCCFQMNGGLRCHFCVKITR
ncbi:MAG: hypothetical protein ACXVBJ_03065, partial [Flavisolibacter sp.]